MKIWVDDIRPCPGDETKDWMACKSTTTTIRLLDLLFRDKTPIDFISLDHDAGDYAVYGGDYINVLNWLEEKQEEGYDIPPIHIHTMNPVGRENMKAIIRRNNWREIL